MKIADSKILEAKNFLERKLEGKTSKMALTLGSGLGMFCDSLEDKVVIPYSEIPHFHSPTVVGHEGQFVWGKSQGRAVLVLQGRIHAYEGHSLEDVVFPTRLLKALGVEELILTNASGAINSQYKPGDLIVIKDHLNLTGTNPLIGPNREDLGPRFPDMSDTWNRDLRKRILKAGKNQSINLEEGIYVGVMGPCYETPAEIQMYKLLGGDMVGMSTVPEVIAGHHAGLKMGGISCITNMAAGLHQGKIDHAHIKEEAAKARHHFIKLLEATLQLS